MGEVWMKPFFEWRKHKKINDYFTFHFVICNQVALSITLFGWGFYTGIWVRRG